MGFCHSGVQHLVCLMLNYLTMAIYETVILKLFKAPGLLLTCYGTANTRCVFYPLVSLVTSGCWMSDEGRDTVAVRLQGLFALHGEPCLLQGMWTVLLAVSLCVWWLTRRTARASFACFATLYQAAGCVRNRNLGWSVCRGIGNCFIRGALCQYFTVIASWRFLRENWNC